MGSLGGMARAFAVAGVLASACQGKGSLSQSGAAGAGDGRVLPAAAAAALTATPAAAATLAAAATPARRPTRVARRRVYARWARSRAGCGGFPPSNGATPSNRC